MLSPLKTPADIHIIGIHNVNPDFVIKSDIMISGHLHSMVYELTTFGAITSSLDKVREFFMEFLVMELYCQ